MKNSISRAAELLACLSVLCLIGCSSGGSNNGSTGSGSGGSGGGTTTSVATPTVTSISPAKLAAGAAATTLTVTGTNFISTSALQVGGVIEPTTYVSATQLTASVPASQLASGADLPVIVLNGESTSASDPAVNLEVDNPSPTITSFTPTAVAVGSASKILSITGTGFVPTTTIQVNGNSRGVTYISSTQVNLLLTVADEAVGTPLSLVAVNAAPGGGTSAAASLPVNYPVPFVTSFAPAVVIVGTTAPTTITVTGVNFTAATTVSVGGTAHTASIISSTQLTFVLSVADQAVASNLAVTVTNPSPGGGTSSARTLPVAAPTPTPVITSVDPASFIVGSPDTQITVSGTNLVPNSTGLSTLTSVVQWNGSSLVTTGYSFSGNSNSGYLIATVPASLLASAGTATITVNSQTSQTPLSNALTVTIGNPPAPTLTSLSPNYGPINTATSITLSGTGFSTASTVSLNGTVVPTTYNNSTSLSVSVPAATLALPANYSFTVTTPAPGGGTSASQVFSAYVPLVSNNAIYNPVDGLFYASIPGSVPAPLGNSVVSVNPATGALGTPIFVGSEPDKLALTADGRYLWVGLDGASAVRKVDLVAKTAGLQFSLPLVNSGIYNSPATPQALAALPGATDSVIVALSSSTLNSNIGLAIFDSGVARANTSSNTIYNNEVFAIQVDGTKNEIYAGGQSVYDVFTYSSTGVAPKVTLTNITTANYSQGEMQLLSGKLFTDFGQVFDSEAGALLGSLYLNRQTVAQGATLADATLGKIFVVDSSAGFSYNGFDQIQIFKLSDYSSTGATIPVNVPEYLSNNFTSVVPTGLTRWGANGLAFHTPFGIYSLQSNSVADLSSTTADLGVTLTSGGATTTGGNTTFTAVVSNSGPSTATDVVLTAQPPAVGTLVSATSTAGSCTTAGSVTCALGSLASGSSATITLSVLQTTAGTSTISIQVAGSTTDSNIANNSATASATITGAAYSVAPALTSIAPAAIETGATDTTLTVNGSGFISGSIVMLGSTSLTTSFVSSTQLTATVPAASLTTLGWSPVTVVTPAPGGGTSSPLPLTVYSVITLGANHILYDPYSRNIMASVGSGSSSVTGNSIAAINPNTASVGTPVSIGSQPTNLALSSDGQILYTVLSGSQSVARYNMLTGQPDFTYTVPANSSFDGGIALRGIAVQPGTENTIALDLASFSGNALFDFDPVNKTAAIRGQATGPYTGSCIAFLDAADFLSFDIDTTGFTLDHYTVTSSGFQYYNYSQFSASTLNHFGCFKLNGGLAFADGGGIANPATEPATPIATLAGISGGGFSNSQALAPDASLQLAFYPAISSSSTSSTGPDGLTAFDLNTYQPTLTLPLNMAAIEGASSGYNQVDMIRWGQDGLAILTSTGHIYILRGAAIVPGLLSTGASAASLTAVSSPIPAVGSGNVLLTLTGSNFAPGTAVTWNGSYRTTTIIDPTHVTVAIPASDLATAATASLVATNPGATASNALSVQVQ